MTPLTDDGLLADTDATLSRARRERVHGASCDCPACTAQTAAMQSIPDPDALTEDEKREAFRFGKVTGIGFAAAKQAIAETKAARVRHPWQPADLGSKAREHDACGRCGEQPEAHMVQLPDLHDTASDAAAVIGAATLGDGAYLAAALVQAGAGTRGAHEADCGCVACLAPLIDAPRITEPADADDRGPRATWGVATLDLVHGLCMAPDGAYAPKVKP